LNLAEAAAEANELAERGDERALADLRTRWDDELEAAVRHADYRVRAQGYRAIGQFRFRQKLELLRRGLEDESPAARGSALLSLELLSREHPGAVNAVRSLLHELLNADPNAAVRRLAAAALRNGSPQRETIVLLAGIADDERQDADVRAAARKVAGALTKRSRTTR
jgi:HEAT repeat protein